MNYENWDPFEDLLALREKMNALFERSIERSSRELSSMGLAPVSVNLWDSKDAYYIYAEVPGVNLKDIEVTVVGEHLTIKGVRERARDAETNSFMRIERNFGNFSRRFVLPDPVDSAKVDASLKDGVLKITVPKITAETKFIPIKTE